MVPQDLDPARDQQPQRPQALRAVAGVSIQRRQAEAHRAGRCAAAGASREKGLTSMRAIVAGVMLLCAQLTWSAVMVQDKVQDVYVPADPGDVQIDGVLGSRMKINLEKRLLQVDEAALLGGFQKRPGS